MAAICPQRGTSVRHYPLQLAMFSLNADKGSHKRVWYVDAF